MARIERIKLRLDNWALWKARLGSSSLGFHSVNILAVGHPAGELKSPDRHATERIPTSELVIHA